MRENLAFRLTHLPALDGLRGLAALAVMAFHFGVLPGGYLGVDIFFVLSGFLITSLLVREQADRGSISYVAFYLRRGLRLLPALLCLLLVWAPFVTLPEVLMAAGYVANWAPVLGWVPATAALGKLGHTWSLAIEEHFYLVWPLVLGVALRRGWRLRTLALGALLVAGLSFTERQVLNAFGAGWLRVYRGSDSHLDGLMLGAALALAMAWGPRLPANCRRWLGLGGWVFASCLALILALTPNTEVAVLYLHLPLVMLGTAVVILAVLPASAPLSKLLAVRPLVGAGRISYALYLWHVPVGFSISELGVPLGSPAYLLLAGSLSVLAALLSYRYVEQPTLRAASAWRTRQTDARPIHPTPVVTDGV